MRVALIGSSGGHLDPLLALRGWWAAHDRFWVTFPTADASDRLVGERVYPAYHPTTLHVGNLARNWGLARRVLAAERPDVVVSAGAAVAIPFFLEGRRRGAKTVWIEVIDRIDTPSRTGRVLGKLADRVAVQWEEQRRHYPNAVVIGALW